MHMVLCVCKLQIPAVDLQHVGHKEAYRISRLPIATGTGAHLVSIVLLHITTRYRDRLHRSCSTDLITDENLCRAAHHSFDANGTTRHKNLDLLAIQQPRLFTGIHGSEVLLVITSDCFVWNRLSAQQYVLIDIRLSCLIGKMSSAHKQVCSPQGQSAVPWSINRQAGTWCTGRETKACRFHLHLP